MLFASLGLVYALLLKSDAWVASQGLMIRDEANGAVMRLGRFESQTAMKAAQETILEMARSPQVLRRAYRVVGPEPVKFSWNEPQFELSNEALDELAKQVEVRAPRGAELGTTEVIYLDVEQASRTRALELNMAICEALEDRLNQIRESRARGVIDELRTARQAAAETLQAATQRLKDIESDVGNDLSDLRGLIENSVSASSTRQTLDIVNSELRTAELELYQTRMDLRTAEQSLEDPEQLLQTPTKLVQTQPGLRQLREGLANAAIRASELSSRYTQSHPLVMAAEETKARIQQELRVELQTCVATLRKDVELATARVEQLKNQKNQLENRIAKLAAVRAEYENVVNDVKSCATRLQDAERELAAAQAAREAALTSSLITRIDSPIVGDDPLGPGKTTIVLGAGISGLMFGLGLVFLLTPMDGYINFGRRRMDYSGDFDRRGQQPTTREAYLQRQGNRDEHYGNAGATGPELQETGETTVRTTRQPSPSFSQLANDLPSTAKSAAESFGRDASQFDLADRGSDTEGPEVDVDEHPPLIARALQSAELSAGLETRPQVTPE